MRDNIKADIKKSMKDAFRSKNLEISAQMILNDGYVHIWIVLPTCLEYLRSKFSNILFVG